VIASRYADQFGVEDAPANKEARGPHLERARGDAESRNPAAAKSARSSKGDIVAAVQLHAAAAQRARVARTRPLSVTLATRGNRDGTTLH
jgi:hypothetical protein